MMIYTSISEVEYRQFVDGEVHCKGSHVDDETDEEEEENAIAIVETKLKKVCFIRG